MSQAAYMNGYDDGYEDAKKELAKSDGPGSGGGTVPAAPSARQPRVFTLASRSVLLDVPELSQDPDEGVAE